MHGKQQDLLFYVFITPQECFCAVNMPVLFPFICMKAIFNNQDWTDAAAIKTSKLQAGKKRTHQNFLGLPMRKGEHGILRWRADAALMVSDFHPQRHSLRKLFWLWCPA